MEICLAAHFGRGGTTYAGLLARPGLLACLGLLTLGLLACLGLLTLGLLARSVHRLTRVDWPDAPIGNNWRTPPRFTGRLRWSAPLRRPVSDGRAGGEGVEVCVPHAATNRDLGPG